MGSWTYRSTHSTIQWYHYRYIPLLFTCMLGGRALAIAWQEREHHRKKEASVSLEYEEREFGFCLIVFSSLKCKKKYWTIRSATHDQLFKQLASQEQVPVALLLVQTVTLHILNYQFLWRCRFVVWSQRSQPFATGCVISNHPLPYSPSSFLAFQPNALDKLVDMACLLVDAVRKSKEFLCIYIQWQHWNEVCDISPVGTLNSTNLTYMCLDIG